MAEELQLNFVSGSWYPGAYLFPQEELAIWVKPQVKAWAHGVRVIGKIFQHHPHSVYASLVMPLQLEWQFMQRTVPELALWWVPLRRS